LRQNRQNRLFRQNKTQKEIHLCFWYKMSKYLFFRDRIDSLDRNDRIDSFDRIQPDKESIYIFGTKYQKIVRTVSNLFCLDRSLILCSLSCARSLWYLRCALAGWLAASCARAHTLSFSLYLAVSLSLSLVLALFFSLSPFRFCYGVATISRLLKIIGLSCRI